MSSVPIEQAKANGMVEKAITFCAERKFSGNIREAQQALSQGRCDICNCLSESLVVQVGKYLGQIDRTVKAVYQYEPEFATLRLPTGDLTRTGRKGGINLVVWVDRKSAALNALSDTLETVLSESRRKIGCKNAGPACYTLDVQLVDNKEIQERRGYGVVVNSMYVRSTQVWARDDQAEQTIPFQVDKELLTTLDPEIAPENALFEQAQEFEKLPEHERMTLEHRLREIKVALIRRMINDQLAYINIAKEWFSVADLVEINQRKIGYGKIGGKAAGLLLAENILKKTADETIRACLRTPESYYLGSDVMYIFMAMNGLMHWNDQKYKPENQIRTEYARIKEEFRDGVFPPEVREALKRVLEKLGRKPLIVRSSSQLEDNFGTAFAGKYDSHFCPNQGSPEENLQVLTKAIACTYASTLKPEALLYRRQKGLQDYDERMAILIQAVEGEIFGKYFLPYGAGVAFSHNLYRWSPKIRREDGFARLVWGLGTRAVERVGNDYPRAVALSHPTLQPDDSPEAICHYSQQYVDLIDLEENTFKTLPVHEVLRPSYPPLRFIAQLCQEELISTPRSRVMEAEIPQLVITFDELLRRTPFAARLSQILRLLEEHYHSAVDMEFTVFIPDTRALQPQIQISLLQCRPQSTLKTTSVVRIPDHLVQEDIILSTNFLVPQGHLSNIRYVLFVSPEAYFALPTPEIRKELSGVISQLNSVLPERSFLCIGPGRWGTTNIDLGVYVSYSDICHAGALVEISGKGIGTAPEPSLGTHFFQDLMEAQIYPLALNLDDSETVFNHSFFYDTPDNLQEWIAIDDRLKSCLHLIRVDQFKPGFHLELVMDDTRELAVAFFLPG